MVDWLKFLCLILKLVGQLEQNFAGCLSILDKQIPISS